MKISKTRISFMGSPIAWDWAGRLASLASRRDVQSIGFAIAASEVCLKIGVLSMGHSLTMKDAIATGIFIGVVNLEHLGMSYLFEYLWMRIKFTPDDRKNKCIDTQPDQRIPPNLDKWGQQAVSMRKNYKFLSIAVAAVCVLSGGMYLIGAAPLLVRQIQGWQRWLKVERGEWRITDKGPPPEPVRQTKNNLASLPAAPAPTS